MVIRILIRETRSLDNININNDNKIFILFWGESTQKRVFLKPFPWWRSRESRILSENLWSFARDTGMCRSYFRRKTYLGNLDTYQCMYKSSFQMIIAETKWNLTLLAVFVVKFTKKKNHVWQSTTLIRALLSEQYLNAGLVRHISRLYTAVSVEICSIVSIIIMHNTYSYI